MEKVRRLPVASIDGMFTYTFTIEINETWVNIPYLDAMDSG